MIKENIRKTNKNIRSKMTDFEVFNKSKKLCKNFLDTDMYKNSSVIMLYYPLGNEPDTRMLFEKLFYDKKTVLLPVTVNNVIIPSKISPKTEFVLGEYSILQPKTVIEYDKSKIDLIIVPGIAFDRSGARVGFGKGCYDVFLENTRAKKVGYCYDFQICDAIKTDKFDINMDYLITESEMIICE